VSDIGQLEVTNAGGRSTVSSDYRTAPRSGITAAFAL